MKRGKRKKRKKMLTVSKKEKKILQYLVKHGPSWYYELSKKAKVASNKTVLAAFKHLDGLLLEVKEKRESESASGMGRKRFYRGLTFRGLHYILVSDCVSAETKDLIYKNIKDVIRDHKIDMANFNENEYRNMIRNTMVGAIKPFFVELGRDAFRKLVKFQVENYPREFFEGLTVNPLTKNRRNYLQDVTLYAGLRLAKMGELSEETFFSIIGEDAFRVLQPTMRVIGSEKEVLDRLPSKLRKRVKRKLDQLK